MLRLLFDESVNNDILHGLMHRVPTVDAIRAQDAGLAETADELILAFAAEEGRIVVTHDIRTMIGKAYARVRAGLPMPGLFVIRQTLPVGIAIRDLVLFVECSTEHEWEAQVVHFPI